MSEPSPWDPPAAASTPDLTKHDPWAPTTRSADPWGAVAAAPAKAPASPSRLVDALLVVGGAGMVVGSFLAWITLDTPFGSLTVKGTDDGKDGNITIVLGALVVAAAIWRFVARRLPVWASVVVLVLGAGGLLTGLADLGDVTQRIDDLNKEAAGYGSASVGVGLYLEIAFSAVVVAGGILSIRKR